MENNLKGALCYGLNRSISENRDYFSVVEAQIIIAGEKSSQQLFLTAERHYSG